jgi:hypothetical protein
MALQTFTAGQVLTAAQVNALQANDYNQTVSTKTDSYTLVAADKGTRVVMNKATATTITVNTDLFNAGDTLWIQNIGAGTCTITAGTATVTTSSSLALAQWQGGTLYFTSTGAAIFFLTGSSGVTALADSAISGTTGSPTTATYTDGFAYKTYRWTGTGSLTTTKAGLVDILLVGGGAGSGSGTNNGGGGAGAYIQQTVYLDSGTCNVIIGAGGARGLDFEGVGSSGFPTAIGVGTNVWTYIAGGGGGGGAEISAQAFQRKGIYGASGGGSVGGNSHAGGVAVLAGQGNNGGAGPGSQTSSGGGGGYVSAGAAGSGSVSGAGGNGISSTFVNGSTGVGYAGGGGGSGGSQGANGTGGGGTANTGGGGRSGAGGSGLVVIRVRA